MGNMKTHFMICGSAFCDCPHMEEDKRCQLGDGNCALQDVAEAPRPPAPFGLLERFVKWLSVNICFVSWGKHWKGVYLHIFPIYCVRVFIWGIDWHKKPKHFAT